MTNKEYQLKLLELLHSMKGQEIDHCLYGRGTIVGFEESIVLIKFEQDDVKRFSNTHFFDKVEIISPSFKDKLDEIKVEYLSSQNKSIIPNTQVDKKSNFERPKSKVTFDDIIGLESVKEQINKMIVYPFKYKDIYKAFNRNPGGGILLYGAPGTGKTMIAKSISNEIDAKFFYVKCSDIVSSWFGKSEKNIRELFNRARESEKSVIFFDEFDSLGVNRDKEEGTPFSRIVSELLVQMDGYEEFDNTILVIAATNKPWNIDSALLRSGRFNRKIYVDIPNEDNLELLIKHELNGIPCEDIDYHLIVKDLIGFSSADVVEFCNEVKDIAIARSVEKGYIDSIKINDLVAAKQTIKSTISKKEIDKLINYCF